ncbi:hypothetical protein G6O69_04875 [Pseudenhygromyxa sp. WMMC2535]|uniref:hypothetical protein n=1 Tax=Pseudenhygromyxa sp. WMMC2535 TaxID=2712867 RepID=UPI0015551A62|nr:hypothetical protein [Pseudenhygromyxa sp. WMMC2535]NVB37153.1 hypothetical protein [Pseudenhygromyxa sp. WMMC2535]
MSAQPPRDEGLFELGGELEFEHVGSMTLAGALLLCDVEYLPRRFAGMRSDRAGLDLELEVEAGTWELLLAYAGDKDEDASPDFVLLTHERELDDALPLDQADALALLRVDSGRIVALDPALRDDVDMLRAVLEAPREQVPCMLTPLAEAGGDAPAPDASPRGGLVDLDRAGTFALYGPPGRPLRALFFAVRSE